MTAIDNILRPIFTSSSSFSLFLCSSDPLWFPAFRFEHLKIWRHLCRCHLSSLETYFWRMRTQVSFPPFKPVWVSCCQITFLWSPTIINSNIQQLLGSMHAHGSGSCLFLNLKLPSDWITFVLISRSLQKKKREAPDCIAVFTWRWTADLKGKKPNRKMFWEINQYLCLSSTSD